MICCAGFQNDALSHVINELGRFAPREVLLSPGADASPELRDFLAERLSAMPEISGMQFDYMPCSILLCRQFGFDDVDASGLGEEPAAVCAVGALLHYLADFHRIIQPTH